MPNTPYQQAQTNALEKVFLSIAETGKPTPEQLNFIKMMTPKENPMQEAEEAGKFLMTMFGFMEGK